MTLPEPWRGPGRSAHETALVAAGNRVPAASGTDPSADRIDMRAVSDVLRRRAWLILGAFALGVLAAVGATLLMTPTYVARADLLMEADAAVTPAARDDAPILPDQGSWLDTRMQLLQSRGLAGQVVQSTGLDRDADFLGLEPGAELPPAALAKRRAIDRLLGAMEVTRLGASSVVAVSVTDRNPKRAATAANAIVDSYISESISGQAGANDEAVAILRERVEELRREAQQRTDAVQSYRISNNLLSQSATSLTEQEISQANQQIALARAEAAEARSRLDAARAQLGAGGTGQVGEAATAPVVQALRSQRALLSARLTDLETRYQPTHPDVTTARAQLADLDRQIAAEVNRTLRALEARAVAADGRLASLLASASQARGTLRGNNQSLVALDDLERQAEASQALYDSYLNRYKEVVAKSGAERADARVISMAEVPGRPRSPSLPLNIALGGLLGLLVGMGAALLLEASFAGLTTAEDVERRLGTRSLGGIPKAGGDPLGTIAAEPGGLFAESLRSLLAAVRHGPGRRQVIAVVSALPGEGKTTVAAAMARVAGLAGLRVVVLDCDTVRAGLSATLALPAGRPGLRELLAETSSFEAVRVEDPVGGADILPLTGERRPGERLMDEGRLQGLVARLRESHDVVILDCSPLLPIAEARELAGLADSAVVVARWRKTPDTAVLSALKLLPWSALSDVGVVLNAIDLRRQARFGRTDPVAFYRQYQNYYS